jgi:GxxExxY protein
MAVVDATGNKLTYQIIGAAMKVHNQLGTGYREDVYQRALWTELVQQGIEVKAEFPVEVMYDDSRVGLFYLDLFVEETVVVELKVSTRLIGNNALGQILNYMKATQSPVGLLINFGRQRLDYHRVFPGRVSSPKPPPKTNPT